MRISPVILCGGSGTRLWPLSRKSYPKQFTPLLGDETLFQSTAKRLTDGDGVAFDRPTILTTSDFRFIVTEQLTAAGIDPGAILLEPAPRDTAPAILAAAMYLARQSADAVMLIVPSDHHIPDAGRFRQAIARGLPAVSDGQIVTFGITPTRPETGFGYLELGDDCGDDLGPCTLRGFVEKPDRSKAKAMVNAGGFLWNAGIFMARAVDMIAAFAKHAPTYETHIRTALDSAEVDLGFLRLDADAWDQTDAKSIDYAVMEKADNLTVVPFDGAWSDMGGWDAVWREADKSDTTVATVGDATAIDCENSLIRSETNGLEIVGIGLRNILAVAMEDAVLVADMSRAQDVKRAVQLLTEKGAEQATKFPKEHRPWGWFERLVLGGRFQVKRIHVHPGEALSLQSHLHRSEHWVVVEGTAEVTIGDDTNLISENQSVYIPIGSKHRLANPGKVPVVLIEVQTGAYVGEDDIIRYADKYARQPGE